MARITALDTTVNNPEVKVYNVSLLSRVCVLCAREGRCVSSGSGDLHKYKNKSY